MNFNQIFSYGGIFLVIFFLISCTKPPNLDAVLKDLEEYRPDTTDNVEFIIMSSEIGDNYFNVIEEYKYSMVDGFEVLDRKTNLESGTDKVRLEINFKLGDFYMLGKEKSLRQRGGEFRGAISISSKKLKQGWKVVSIDTNDPQERIHLKRISYSGAKVVEGLKNQQSNQQDAKKLVRGSSRTDESSLVSKATLQFSPPYTKQSDLKLEITSPSNVRVGWGGGELFRELTATAGDISGSYHYTYSWDKDGLGGKSDRGYYQGSFRLDGKKSLYTIQIGDHTSVN